MFTVRKHYCIGSTIMVEVDGKHEVAEQCRDADHANRRLQTIMAEETAMAKRLNDQFKAVFG